MRRATVLAGILILTLVLVPLAAAAKDGTGAASERHAERAEKTSKEKAGKGAPQFLAAFHALRDSWHENATAIREACHAVEKDANATKEERKAGAHCIRDGYKAWFASYRAERREMPAAATG